MPKKQFSIKLSVLKMLSVFFFSAYKTLFFIIPIFFKGKMCVLDCSHAALKILHNSTEFLPYVIFIAAPGMEQLKTLYDVGRSNTNLRYSSRNLTVSYFYFLRFKTVVHCTVTVIIIKFDSVCINCLCKTFFGIEF